MNEYQVPYTPQEQQRLMEIRAQVDKRKRAKEHTALPMSKLWHLRYLTASKEYQAICITALTRQLDKLIEDKDLLYRTFETSLNSLTKEKYIEAATFTRDSMKKRRAELEKSGRHPGVIADIDAALSKEWENTAAVFDWLREETFVEEMAFSSGYNTIKDSGKGTPGASIDFYLEALKSKAAAIYTPTSEDKKQLEAAAAQQQNASQDEEEPFVFEQLNLFNNAFLPMANGTLTNTLIALSANSMRDLTPDPLRGGRVSFTTSKGCEIVIEGYDKLQRGISVSCKKLLNAATSKLTAQNSYCADPAHINPTVILDLKDYLRANGVKIDPRPCSTKEESEAERKRIKSLMDKAKRDITADLDLASSIAQTFTETKGKNKGDWSKIRIISSGSVSRGKIRINFDVDAARYLTRGYLMQFPTPLLKIDNRDTNSYVIGYKIALHNSMDSNQAAGTADTLSVKSLLAEAPDIMSYEELKAKGRRDWKVQIKARLENCLGALVEIGYLYKWHYRDPMTGIFFDARQADTLSWADYSGLMVDFAVLNTLSDQSPRIEAKAKKKEEAEAPKKKPGRPPKNKD